MTKAEFSQAVKIAKDLNTDLSNKDDSIIFGCGLPNFVPVHVTIEQVAKFIRWQALQFNGEFDAHALNECAEIAKKKFLIV